MKSALFVVVFALLCLAGESIRKVEYTCVARIQGSSSDRAGTCRTEESCTKATIQVGLAKIGIWGCLSCTDLKKIIGKQANFECKECEVRSNLCNADL